MTPGLFICSDILLTRAHSEALHGDSVRLLIWKPEVFRQIKEIKRLSGGVALYAAQANAQIDAEMAKKGGFRTETNSFHIML